MLVLHLITQQLLVSSAVHTQGTYQFNVQAIPDSNSVVLNVGVSTTDYLYVQLVLHSLVLQQPSIWLFLSKSYFEVLAIPDADNIKINVGISTINHTYVEGGTLTDLTPAILKLSASQFYEQLPIVVPPYTSIIGNSLRGTQVLPAAGVSDDGSTPNNRSTCSRCLMLQRFRHYP